MDILNRYRPGPGLAWLLGALMALLASSAQAVPAYARQTGQNCIACHVSFPELTPYGRWFKLSGYTIGSSLKVGPASSVLIVALHRLRPY